MKNYTIKPVIFNKKALSMLMLIFAIVGSSFAQVQVPFTQRTSQYTPSKVIYNVKGDFTLIGNSNLTLDSYNVNYNNSNRTMEFVDVDNDSSTENSSSATLTFSTENGANPDCSNIIYAGLYWTGRGDDDDLTNLQKRTIKLKGPNDSSYQTLVANQNDIRYPGNNGMYAGYIEVTDQVRSNGLGEYFVADIAVSEGNGGSTGYYGGWGMIVVYENSKMNWRDVTVFDGYAYVQGNTTTNYELPVSGFNAVQSGPVNIKLGLMAGEGDRGISGDYFEIIEADEVNNPNPNNNDWVDLSHSGNSTSNFFNSSIQTGGNARNPNLVNNTGLDISMFDLDNSDKSLIDNSQTSTKFRYGSTQDTYIIFSMAMSVDAYIPESEGVLSNTTINGSAPTPGMQVLPGDEIEYKVEIKNKGTEPILDARLVIPIPFTSEFIPGSIVHNAYLPAFAAGTPYYDPNEGATGSIVWDINFLPLFPADIDLLLADLSFKLKATEDCSVLVNANCEPKIVILGGYISGTGMISGTDYSLPLIQGYQQEGNCQGEPNTDPIEIDIDAQDYINDNCTGVTVERDFFYCSFEGNSIPVSEIEAEFPPGSRFYDSYPVTGSTTEYTSTNPFPATLGTTTYYAIPPGDPSCHYIFTIATNSVTTTPSTNDEVYCLNETATPLTAQTTDPNYILLFYPDNNPNTVGQTSLIPDTSVAGTFTYYVSEGPNEMCVNSERTPLTVTVYNAISITLEELVHSSCSDSNDGSINISVSGGTGNYTYDWDNNGSEDPDTDSQDLTNLDNGTYTVIVSDENSNCSATATFNVNLIDTTAPTISAPDDIIVEGCSTSDIQNGNLTALPFSSSTATITEAQFLAEGGTFTEDNVDSITYIDVATGSCPIKVSRTYTITDICGQQATDVQVIDINDTTDPVLTVPATANVECGDSIDPSQTGNATATDSCGSVTVTYSDSVAAGTCGNTQTITRTWTATDDCGNDVSQDQIINVIDTTDPVITVPATVDVECGDSIDPSQTGNATATDSCGSVTVTYSDSVAAGSCGNTQTITRTWTATDDCGNDVSQDQIINVIDTTDPVINIDATNIAVECDGSGNNGEIENWLNNNGGAVASDNCGDVTWTNNYNGAQSDCSTPVLVTFTATDACGNSSSTTASYTIQDTANPSIDTEASNLTVQCDGTGNTDDLNDWLTNNGGAIASDDCSTITWTNDFTELSGLCGATGSATVTFTATDGCGNSSTTTAIFTIEDITAPTIDAEASDLTVECDGAGNIADLNNWLNSNGGAIASDLCGNVTWTNDFTELSDLCGATGSATVTFTATDDCGNFSTTTAIFTIEDTLNPVISTVAADQTVQCDGSGNTDELQAWLDTQAGAVAIDQCSTITWTNNYSGLLDQCGATGRALVTFTATDECGNSSSTTALFTILDLLNPTIDTEASDLTVECDGAGNVDDLNDWLTNNGGAIASDVCSDVTWTNDFDKLADACGATGSATVTFTTTDGCGNSSTTTAIFTIVDTTAPTFTVPADVTIECDQDANDLTLTGDVTDEADNCDAGLEATYSDAVADGNCANESVITRTWSVTDDCGNTATLVQTINVVDTTAPVIVGDFETTIDVSCSDIPEVPELVFEDACSSDITVEFNESNDSNDGLEDYSITRSWTVTDECGNEAIYTQIVNVNVESTFTGYDTELCIDDLAIDLFDLLSGDYDSDGVWEVVSGNATLDGSIFDPATVELGDYIFTYTVANGPCPSTVEVMITVHDDCIVLPCGAEDVVISKAVTPNGDQWNEFFTITGVEDCGFTIELQIFNRWGAKIYENFNYQNDWNGTASKASIGRSDKVPSGTYYYIINIKGSNGLQLKPFTGPIYIGTK